MTDLKVSNQAELAVALVKYRHGLDRIVLEGNGRFEFTGSSSPSIDTWGSSSPSIVTWDSSSPSIVTWDSSSPSIDTWGSSSPSGRVAATAIAVVRDHNGKGAQIEGATILPAVDIKSPAGWCEWHGVDVVDGVAVLFKAVHDDWQGPHRGGVTFEPGSTPVAVDWDGRAECGGGLHFSPSPGHALAYLTQPAHFVACPVAVAEAVVIGDKLKARACAGPVYEVDRRGRRIGEAVTG